MVNRSIIVICTMLVIGLAAFSGCIQEEKTIPDTKETIPGIEETEKKLSELGTTQELKKFSSAAEIRDFLKMQASQTSRSYLGGMAERSFAIEEAVMEEMASDMAVPAEAPVSEPAYEKAESEATSASDYSTTNIQVEGVDEADFVKNDGKYIYTLSQNKLIIVDAFPADNASILSKTLIDGRATNMYINGERLMIFVEGSHEVLDYPEYDYRPRIRYAPMTTALVYDISDRKDPEIIADYNINGNYFQSRMIGDYVYFIVKESVYYYNEIINLPVVRKGTEKVLAPDVYYFDNPEQDYVYHTIASININSENELNAKSFMMGYSDNLYVSENNIYITYRKNMPSSYYQVLQEERFFNVVVPMLPSDAQDRINSIKSSAGDSNEIWQQISDVLEETYSNMSDMDKRQLFDDMENALSEYDIRIAQDREKTIIQKIGIDKGSIEYKSKGEVSGTLLNQFSMDESNSYFRLATTSQFWTSGKGSVTYNNVYVLDDGLDIVGELEELAPDERIYSTRFIGNRLYMVTFKRMDPLFVIDLTEPTNPEVLGELKIPGFSDYLHPYDENHIIGIGKETGTSGWGGVSIKGVKLSLFDVSDVSNPKQIDKYEIGISGTDSEALNDHRAFLFNKNKNLLVIPVREVKDEQVIERYGYRQRVWQGAYVFGLTPETGFELKGMISHLDDYEESQYYWNSPYAVRRSLYMDDVLYTISNRKIMMNSLEDMAGINSVELPYTYYGYDRYYESGGIETVSVEPEPIFE